MIRERHPISMSEAMEFISERPEEEVAEIKSFVSKFVKLSAEDAKKLREKIVALDSVRIRDSHIAKIIDLVPETSEELSKIFVDTQIDEEESKKILEIVKEFK